MNDVKGITTKNKSTTSYIHVSTVIRATEIDPNARRTDTTDKKDDCIVEVDNQPEEDSGDSDDTDDNDDEGDDYVAYNTKSKVPLLVSQPELNDFIRNLGLPKDGAEFAASFHKKRNFLKPNTSLISSQ